MCGIAGILDSDRARARERAASLNAVQRHRGPDHDVVVDAGSYTLANTRLAILDPHPRGNQPFASRSGRYICVFNGEIYNYLELIEAHRLDLDTSCDGAIVPELWERLGPASVKLFRGMFAIALVDLEDDSLVLIRDPFGIKPLYTRDLGNGSFAFASEPRSLATIPPRPPFDPAAAADMLRLGALPRDSSPFRGIEQVLPNRIVRYRADEVVEESEIHPEPLPASLRSSGDVADTFRTAIDVHLRSDVPSTLLLSAGIDSTAIASVAHKLDRKLHCLTVAGLGSADESPQARASADLYGHSHEVVPCDVDEASVDAFFRAMQRPTIDGLNTFLVCRSVRQAGFKVALSGLGGDEVLGGYGQFELLKRLRTLRALDRVPGPARRGALSAAAKLSSRFRGDKARALVDDGPRTAWGIDVLHRQIFSKETVRRLTGLDPKGYREVPPPEAINLPPFQQMMAAEIELYLQTTLLPDSDAFSMTHSVELRVPFLDPEVYGTLLAHTEGRGHIDKREFASLLGDEHLVGLTQRKKTGFSMPMAEWMTDGPLRSSVARTMETSAPIWDVIDRDAALPVFDSARWAEPWALVALNGWLATLEPAPAAV